MFSSFLCYFSASSHYRFRTLSPPDCLPVPLVYKGCSASVSLLYAVLHPILLSIRLGREHSFLSWFFHPLFYTLRSVVADETVTYAMQFFGCPYTKRKLSIIGQLFSLQTVVARADGLRQAVLWISKNSCPLPITGTWHKESGRKEESSTIEMSVTRRCTSRAHFDKRDCFVVCESSPSSWGAKFRISLCLAPEEIPEQRDPKQVGSLMGLFSSKQL